MTPGATDMRDLPGGRSSRFTPVSHSIAVSAASPQVVASLHSPHLSQPSYPPAYYAPALGSPSGNHNYSHNQIFLEDENRQLKSKLAAFSENARKVDFLQKSLDHVQVKKKIKNQQMSRAC